MDFRLSKEQELIQKTVREFAEKYIAPVADQIDRENKVPPEIYRKMAELELFGIPFAEEFGGTGAGLFLLPPGRGADRPRLRRGRADSLRQHPRPQRHQCLCHAGAEETDHDPLLPRRKNRLLRLHRARNRLRPQADHDDGGQRRRQLPHQRHEAIYLLRGHGGPDRHLCQG